MISNDGKGLLVMFILLSFSIHPSHVLELIVYLDFKRYLQQNTNK